MRRLSILVVTSFLACTPIDVDRGYGFSCKRESGSSSQCPGDFHCGIENKCIKNEAGPWQCESDIDCYGWHCGVDSRCYDVADAGVVACRDDDDCNNALGWRCSPDSLCVDSSLEVPREATAIGGSVVGRRKQLWTGTPSHVEGYEDTRHLPDGGSCGVNVVTVVSDGELWRLTLPIGLSRHCDTETAPAVPISSVASLAATNAGDFVVTANGQLLGVDYSEDAGRAIPLLDAGLFSAVRARSGLTAFGPGHIYRKDATGEWLGEVDAGGIRDIAVVFDFSERGTLAVLGDSVYAVDFDDGGMTSPLREGLLTSANGCENSRAADTSRLFVAGGSVLDLVPGAFGASSLARYDPVGLADGGCALESGGRSFARTESFSIASTCRPTFMGYTAGSPIACIDADGTVETRLSAPSFAIRRDAIHATATTSSGPSHFTVYAGRFPALHLQTGSTPESPITPMLFDRAPTFVVEVFGRLVVVARDAYTNGVFGVLGVVSGDQIPASGAFASSPFPVNGRPSWLGTIVDDQVTLYLNNASVAVAVDETGKTNDISQAAALDAADGGTVLVAARGDALVVATMAGEQFDSPLRTTLVPAPGLLISSLDLPFGKLGAQFIGGHVVAGGRVFSFKADNAVVWRATELPLGSREAVEVWHDGDRSRAGLRNGEVVSLPSRVAIAPPTSAPARDFLQVCERVFAATEEGLEQLVVAEGAQTGTWSRVETRPGAARLYFRDRTLTIFRDDGDFSELSVPDCAE